jgi:hypothetical protein
MPASQLVSAQHGIIAWPKNADGDTAGLVVQAAILVRRSMEPTGRGAANNIGQPIPTLGVPATTTLNEGYWVFAGRTAPRIQFQASLIWICKSDRAAPNRALLAPDRRYRSAQQDHQPGVALCSPESAFRIHVRLWRSLPSENSRGHLPSSVNSKAVSPLTSLASNPRGQGLKL